MSTEKQEGHTSATDKFEQFIAAAEAEQEDTFVEDAHTDYLQNRISSLGCTLAQAGFEFVPHQNVFVSRHCLSKESFEKYLRMWMDLQDSYQRMHRSLDSDLARLG